MAFTILRRHFSTHANFSLKDRSLLAKTGWIDGSPAAPSTGKTYTLIDPATGEEWHEMPAMGVSETDQAIQAAYRAFPTFSTIPGRTRGKIIMKMDSLFQEAKNDLAQMAVMECGKTLREAEGEVDVGSSYSWLMAGEAERNVGETIRGAEAPNMRYFTIREPVGPAALLSPWNFPIFLPWRKLVSALAAGCTVVMKPSPETATTSVAMAILAQRAGVPDGVVNVITTNAEDTPAVGKLLCEDKRIKKMHFTGSTSVGKLLAKQCAGTLKKMTLEVGGNGAFIVFEDADLEQAAELLVANKFRNAGRVCVTANRVYVQQSIHDDFVSLVETRVRALRLGHGLNVSSTMGSVTTLRGVERCGTLVEDASKHGAKVIIGGRRVGAGHDSLVHREEMFAPILSVYSFEAEEEVVKLANDTDMGLTNYVYTQNISRAWRMFEALKSGQVAINNGNASSSEMPFGGIKESGIGKEGGFGYGIQEFCHVRTAALML